MYLLNCIALYSVYTAYKSILLFVKCLNVLFVKRVNCILHCLEHAPKLFTHHGTRAVNVTIKVIRFDLIWYVASELDNSVGFGVYDHSKFVNVGCGYRQWNKNECKSLMCQFFFTNAGEVILWCPFLLCIFAATFPHVPFVLQGIAFCDFNQCNATLIWGEEAALLLCYSTSLSHQQWETVFVSKGAY